MNSSDRHGRIPALAGALGAVTFAQSPAVVEQPVVVTVENGQPAKGILSYQVLAMPFRANPQPGRAISDIDSSGIFQCIWQIVSPDGKYIGTLYDSGAAPGPDHIVIGGSGAFRGMTGLHGAMEAVGGCLIPGP